VTREDTNHCCIFCLSFTVPCCHFFFTFQIWKRCYFLL